MDVVLGVAGVGVAPAQIRPKKLDQTLVSDNTALYI
jgi:hypothetical protein